MGKISCKGRAMIILQIQSMPVLFLQEEKGKRNTLSTSATLNHPPLWSCQET